MAAQVGILALYSHRVPLSANYPEPIEATADIGVMVVQLVFGVLLAASLLADRRPLIISIVSAVVMTWIGTRIAGRTSISMVTPAIVVGLWLALFKIGRGPVLHPILICLTIAGPVLRYLMVDFSPHLPPPDGIWTVSPTLAVGLLHYQRSLALSAIAWPAALLLGNAFTTALANKIGRGER